MNESRCIPDVGANLPIGQWLLQVNFYVVPDVENTPIVLLARRAAACLPVRLLTAPFNVTQPPGASMTVPTIDPRGSIINFNTHHPEIT